MFFILSRSCRASLLNCLFPPSCLSRLASRISSRPTARDTYGQPIGLLLCFLYFSPLTVEAQLVECDGVWTNRACDSSIEKSLTESPSQPVNLEKSKRDSLLHDLTMQQIKAKRDHDLDISLEYVKAFCAMENTSYLDCSKEVAEQSSRIARHVERRMAAEQKVQKEPPEKLIQENPPSTVININRTFIPRRRRRILRREASRAGGQTNIGASFGSSSGQVNVEAETSYRGSHRTSRSRKSAQ